MRRLLQTIDITDRFAHLEWREDHGDPKGKVPDNTILHEKFHGGHLPLFGTKLARNPRLAPYLGLDISEGWNWNNCDPAQAKKKLNNIVKKRGDIAQRSLRPTFGEAQPPQHAMTKEELRKLIISSRNW